MAREPMLLPGDWVEVLPARRIGAMLDGDGTLERLPFMPEMLPFCGRRFRVLMRAETTCVHPPQRPFRRLDGCVVLQDVRCDGGSHAGCQLGCTILWKEAWLKRVDGPGVDGPAEATTGLILSVKRADDPDAYTCQGTALVMATRPGVPGWTPGQYVRFLRVRTFSAVELARMFQRVAWRKLSAAARRVWPPRPLPSASVGALGLKPGEWVQVKSREEIASTLDARGRARGLGISPDMYAFCGRRMRVLERVETILSEETGRPLAIRDTVFLEGCVCDRYWGCARRMPFMWREAWLRRIEPPRP